MAALDLGTAEADGATLVACSGATLSPLQITTEYDPWSTGSEVYGVLGGSLQITGEADGQTSTAAAAGLPREGLQGEADGAAAGTALSFLLNELNIIAAAPGLSHPAAALGGSLQIAAEADGASAPAAQLSGGGTPTPLEASALGATQTRATIRAANAIAPSETEGEASAEATMGVGTGRASAAGAAAPKGTLSTRVALNAAIAGASAPAAELEDISAPIGTAGSNTGALIHGNLIILTALHGAAAGSTAIAAAKLTDDPLEAATSAGGSATAAEMSVVTSISGRVGPDGWESPQIAGEASGETDATAKLSRNGMPTVELAGSGGR